jgi:hypothetical protein
MVQKGKLAACAASEPTNALNRVLFPTLGNPTIPQFSFMDKVSLGNLNAFVAELVHAFDLIISNMVIRKISTLPIEDNRV